MKAVQLSSLFLIVIMGLTACEPIVEKDDFRPSPMAEINFAYEKPGLIDRFKNQSQLIMDSLTTLTYFGFAVDERYHSSYCGFTTDSGVIEFEVKTNLDQETFNNRKGISSHGTWRSMTGNNFSFGGDLYVPFKLSNIAVKGNDTLEISSNGDLIKAFYQSKYSGLNCRDSIEILK